MPSDFPHDMTMWCGTSLKESRQEPERILFHSCLESTLGVSRELWVFRAFFPSVLLFFWGLSFFPLCFFLLPWFLNFVKQFLKIPLKKMDFWKGPFFNEKETRRNKPPQRTKRKKHPTSWKLGSYSWSQKLAHEAQTQRYNGRSYVIL